MAPEISIVIPTQGSRDALRVCLESLSTQTAPPASFEVVLAVDGSEVGTEDLLDAVSAPYALRVVARQSGSGPALNAGVDAAEGKFVLLLTDDMIASPALVEAHCEAQRGEDPVAAIGVVTESLSSNGAVPAGHGADRSATPADVEGGNFSLPRAVYSELGGVTIDAPTDAQRELALRLAERGIRLELVPRAVAARDVRANWRRTVREQERRGEVSVELYGRRPAILPWLPLGGRGDLQGHWSVLKAMLLALHAPPLPLAALARALPARHGRTWLGFVSGYAFWVGVRRAADRDTWQRLKRGVAILMYHGIGSPGERPTRWVVSVKRFERQMRWLERRGYNVASLDDFLAWRREFQLPPPKCVVITFDDGYVDNLALARPVLERLGFPATIFLLSAAGERNTWSTTEGVAGRTLISLDAARAALGGVLTFGAHTRTHPKLPALEADEAAREVVDSKRELEEALGVPVTTFAYPYGRLDTAVKDVVAAAGFAGACGVLEGRNRPATDGLALRRIEVSGTYRLPSFAAVLWLGSRPFRRRKDDHGARV